MSRPVVALAVVMIVPPKQHAPRQRQHFDRRSRTIDNSTPPLIRSLPVSSQFRKPRPAVIAVRLEDAKERGREIRPSTSPVPMRSHLLSNLVRNQLQCLNVGQGVVALDFSDAVRDALAYPIFFRDPGGLTRSARRYDVRAVG